MKQIMNSLGLFGFMIISMGCNRILGSRHTVLINLSAPSWVSIEKPVTFEDVELSRSILETRLKSMGAVNVHSEVLGTLPHQMRVRITYFGTTPNQQLVMLLGETGRINFHLAVSEKYWPNYDAAMQDFKGALPPGTGLFHERVDFFKGAHLGFTEAPLYLLQGDPAPFTNADLRHCEPAKDSSGHPAVKFIFNEEAGIRFQKFTENNLNKILAILLDGKVISVQRLESPIGDSVISQRNFSQDEVALIVVQLNDGVMPMEPQLIEVN